MLNLTHKVHHKIQVIQQTVQHTGQLNKYNIYPVNFKVTREVRHDMCKRTKLFSQNIQDKLSIPESEAILINKMAICNKRLLSHSAFALVDPTDNKKLVVYVATGQSADISVPCTEYTGINKLERQKVDPVTISYKNLYNSYISPRPYSWRLGPNETLYDNKFVRVLNKGDDEFIQLYYDDLVFFNLHKCKIEEYLNLYLNLEEDHKMVNMNGFEVLFTFNFLNYNKQVGILTPEKFVKCMQYYEAYKNDYNLIMARCGADLGL
jgi:hypothetical protein